MISAGLTEKAETLKKPVGGVPFGGMAMLGGLGSVQLRKVEKPEVGEKITITGPGETAATTNEKNQNIQHLSNILVQGAIRKSNFFFLSFFLILNLETITNKSINLPSAFQKK